MSTIEESINAPWPSDGRSWPHAEVQRRLHLFNLTNNWSYVLGAPEHQQVCFLYPHVLRSPGQSQEDYEQDLIEMFGELSDEDKQAVRYVNEDAHGLPGATPPTTAFEDAVNWIMGDKYFTVEGAYEAFGVKRPPLRARLRAFFKRFF